MKFKFQLVVVAFSLMLVACGGGGESGGSNDGGNGGEHDLVDIIDPFKCVIGSLPQGRMLDLDKAGYVYWTMLTVVCTERRGATVSISDLPLSAFTFTGNGVIDTPPEDMVVGTSSSDGTTTYLVQSYRKFTSVDAVQSENETLTVRGIDANGRTVLATQLINPASGSNYAVDDLGQGITLAASRTLDADGQGYTATTFIVAYDAKNPSTSPPCSVATGVKDYPLAAENSYGVFRDRRYCMYTGLTGSDFSYAGKEGTWRWKYGVDEDTMPTLLKINSATISIPTLDALRTPIYKVVSSVRFPIKPVPNFAFVESGGTISSPGWIIYSTPMTTNELATTDGASWF